MVNTLKVVISNFCKASGIVFLTTLIVAFPLLSARAEVTIRIGYAQPWSAGEDTIKKMLEILPYKKYEIKLIKTDETVRNSIQLLAQKRVDIAILRHSQWFIAINAGLPFLAVAETGPHLAVVNEPVFRAKRENITGFLVDWQNSWSKTDYPYGVQPPEVRFLTSKYEDFLHGLGPGLGPGKVNLESKYSRKFMVAAFGGKPLKWSSARALKALAMTKDYYASIGIKIINVRNATKGETYEGRIKQRFSQFIELDKNPCKDDLINIEKPYNEIVTGKTKICDGKIWRIYRVTKR